MPSKISRREIIRLGLAAVACSGIPGTEAQAHDVYVNPDPNQLLDWCIDEARKGAGKNNKISDDVIREYIKGSARYPASFKDKVRKGVSLKDIVTLGGLSHKWGEFAAEAAGGKEIDKTHAKRATARIRDELCPRPLAGGWCELS